MSPPLTARLPGRVALLLGKHQYSWCGSNAWSPAELVTSATLLGTSALLVVTRSY